MKLERRSFIKSAALLALPGMPSLGLGSDSTNYASYTDDATLLNLGVKTQLFFDDLLIESVQDITREFHQPKKVQENPLITKDKPWEHVLLVRTASYRVLHDPKDKLFKAWYSDEGWTQQLVESEVTWPMYRDHYAYSEDGIKWIKPGLGIYRENGQDTNIFRGDMKTGSAEVFDLILDPFESDESKRFKGIHLWAPVDEKGQGHYETGHFVISCSADGIHWTPYDELPTFGKIGHDLDDVVVLNYDLDSRLYLLNTRHLDMERAPLNTRFPKNKSFFRPHYPDDFSRINKRRIYQCESSDLIHWNEPRLILAPDDSDNLDDYFYGMAQFRVGDTWVGFLNVLHSVSDTFEVRLTYSLDGRRWKQIRKPWFTVGPPGSWDQFMVEISTEPVRMGDELWFYYGGNGYGHHDWYSEWWREGTKPPDSMDVNKVGFFLGLAKLRLDGFCSLNAGPVREGIFITRQLGSEGTGVVINAECGPGGYIDVEVMNQADEVIPGYSRKEFDRFTGDAVRHQLSWQSKTSVPSEPYRRLVFYMRNAKVYSLQFSS
jgi:hypothetical protein